MFPCKLLLFGEYTILDNGAALAMPLKNFGGQWAENSHSKDRQDTGAGLWQLLEYAYLQDWEELYDLERWENDLEAGVWFDANVPQGYGLGSSGAVAAAVYQRYRLEPRMQLKSLKTELARLENCWHKNSSGIDPLVSYLHRPIFMQNKEEISIKNIDIQSLARHFCLLDTQIKRSTAPLVSWFLLQSEREEFKTACVSPLKDINNEACQAILTQDYAAIGYQMKTISSLQYTHLQHLIPSNFSHLWKQGLDSGDFYLKICGAGGGGFLLVWTAEPQVKTELRAAGLQLLDIIG